MCLHSGGLSGRQWDRLRDRLAASHRVLVPDFVGYGMSTPWPATEPFDFAMDLEAVVRLIEDIGRPCHLVGHSYGGMIALKAARRDPGQVRSVVAIEPVTFSVLWDRPDERAALEAMQWADEVEAPVLAPGRREEWLRRFVDWWNAPGAWDRLPEPARERWRAIAHKLYGEVRCIARDRTPAWAYAEARVPTLLVTAQHSPYAARRVAAVLAAELPRARLHEIPDAGHMAPLTHPDAVNALVVGQLERAPGARSTTP